jgi:hypothetical protein
MGSRSPSVNQPVQHPGLFKIVSVSACIGSRNALDLRILCNTGLTHPAALQMQAVPSRPTKLRSRVFQMFGGHSASFC